MDPEAFHTQVEQHSRAVFRLAYRMTGNQTEAEDIVQETFLRAWKQLARFDGRAAFGTWVHRICVNCALDHLRGRKREDRDGSEDPFRDMAHKSPSPERMAMSAEIGAALTPALDELSAMERSAFVMRHYDGLAIDDISLALGVDSNAAKHSVFRAVKKLRKALEPVRVARL